MEDTTTAPDYINLVPLGLIVIAVYHSCLLRRIIHRPTNSIAAINRQYFPVPTEKQGTVKNKALAVQTLRSRITAAAMTAWVAIMLGSSISILTIKAHCAEQSMGMLDRAGLVAYLVTSFLLSVQTRRYYGRASMMFAAQARCRGKYNVVVNRGLCFRAMGLRGVYLAVPPCLWIFGSIIMVVGCIAMIVLMYVLDTRCDWSEGEEKEKVVFEESVKDVAEPLQSVSRHERVISTVELLEIIVVKNWD